MMHKAWCCLVEVPYCFTRSPVTWWCHQMETFPRYWPFVRGIHRSRWIPRTKASDAELWCILWSAPEKRLSKQPWGWWFETPSWSLWCHWTENWRWHGLVKQIIDFDQIGRFRTVTPVWIHHWLRNDTQSLKQHRRGALLIFKVIHQISGSHGTNNRRFLPELSVSRLKLKFEFTHCFEMMQKAGFVQMRYPFFQGHLTNFRVRRIKIADFDPNWAFLERNSSLN